MERVQKKKKGFILQAFKNNCSKMGFRGLSAYHQVVAETMNSSWSHGAFEGRHRKGAEVILGGRGVHVWERM